MLTEVYMKMKLLSGPRAPACYATFQMRGIFYIWAMNTWPFCHFGREINKMFKNEQCSGSIICHLSLWGIHGTFNFSIFTTNSNAVAWSHQTSNNTGLAGNLLLRPPSPMAEMAAEPEQEEVGPHKCRVAARTWLWGCRPDYPHPQNLPLCEQKMHCHFLFDILEGNEKRYFHWSGILG